MSRWGENFFTPNRRKVKLTMRDVDSEIKLKEIRDNLKFILTHFVGQHELFPRTIMTSEIKYQKKIDYHLNEQTSMDETIRYFQDSKFKDCKINAFSYNYQHNIDFAVKNKTAPTFIMIDLDPSNQTTTNPNPKKTLEKDLHKTIQKMSTVFHGQSNPTILATGNGYHIYQPIEPIDGEVLERFEIFYDFLPYLRGWDLTTEFLRFAEKFLSLAKSDSNHNPSIQSCLLRIPGTINTKNNSEVKIIQKWDGRRPPIQYILPFFMSHLIQRRIDRINQRQTPPKRTFQYSNDNLPRIGWIEKLLQTPLEDYRKVSVDLILIPYLVVVQKNDENTVFNIINEWLSKCSRLRNVNTDAYYRIRFSIKTTNRKQIPPMKIKTIQCNRPHLFELLKKRYVVI